MGSRRGMLLLESPRLEDERNDRRARDAVAEFCLKRSIPRSSGWAWRARRATPNAVSPLPTRQDSGRRGFRKKSSGRRRGGARRPRAASATNRAPRPPRRRGDDGRSDAVGGRGAMVAWPSWMSPRRSRAAPPWMPTRFHAATHRPRLRALCASGPRVEVRRRCCTRCWANTRRKSRARTFRRHVRAGLRRRRTPRSRERHAARQTKTKRSVPGRPCVRRHRPARAAGRRASRATRGVWREKIVVSAPPS